MGITSAQCPSCGASVTFKIGSSVVLVCASCKSLVARTDRDIASLGKVAALLDTSSALRVGLKGAYQGQAFEFTGRAQIRHAQGGIWDEWYAAFRDGRWGWLAEAQGRFYLTFSHALTRAGPAFESLNVGQPVQGLGVPIVLNVAEKGLADYRSAEGEIPFRLTPDDRYAYADLAGQQGEFATLDYSEDTPLFYLGREVTLAEMGIDPNRLVEREKTVAAAALACPQCGGALELKAPDRAERVTCPYCNSLLDVNQGQLQYLKTLDPPKRMPVIALGGKAEFEGVSMTVIGFLVRSVTLEGIRYPWEEYLLYHPQPGFRWLVHSDRHWTYVRPLAPGLVSSVGGTARFRGKTFKRFQDAKARVDYVLGEFYWKVEAGETVKASDFIRPPEMLSKESTEGELNWSLGTYLPVAEVRSKFLLPHLPQPGTVGPCEPFPYRWIYPYWAGFSAAALLLFLALMFSAPGRLAYVNRFEAPALETAQGAQILFSEPFELQARENLLITASAPVNNSWVFLEGDLIDQNDSVVRTFTLPVEHYFGVEDGESWSEGGPSSEEFLSAVPAGRYNVRIEAQWSDWNKPKVISLECRQGVPRPLHFLLSLGLLSIFPLCIMLKQHSFEKRRWEESMYNPYSSDEED